MTEPGAALVTCAAKPGRDPTDTEPSPKAALERATHVSVEETTRISTPARSAPFLVFAG
ncbi:MAG TPA: hypothetical protein VG184_01115 [Acidimicrobiales bacterium]|nr:hypothetical protein [Acidimicrobiales bacterium]